MPREVTASQVTNAIMSQVIFFVCDKCYADIFVGMAYPQNITQQINFTIKLY